jgi:hypothetical protein
MNLRNYTSEVPAAHSVAKIAAALVDHGATDIQHTYADKQLIGIAFIITLPEGQQMPIKLPARTKQIEILLTRELRRRTPETLDRAKAQAQRTAWKLLAEWVEIQLTLIRLQQVEFLEVFLPYVYRPSEGTTFYEEMKARQFLALTNSVPAPERATA